MESKEYKHLCQIAELAEMFRGIREQLDSAVRRHVPCNDLAKTLRGVERNLFQELDALKQCRTMSVQAVHPEACTCDECAAIRFAYCGYED